MSSLLLISSIIVLTKAAIFSTGKVDIINPDVTATGTEVHNASITITINNETNSVELHMLRHAPLTATNNFVWTGFGFDYLPYKGATYHNNSYAIILDYDVDDTPSVSEYTLGYDDIDNTPLDPPQTEGVLYPFTELTILSDVTNGDMREVIATRPINGTFTFLNTQILNNYQIIVTAAIHNRNPTYKNSLRHQSNSDDRNFTTATFELVPTRTPTMSPTVECNVFQSTINATHLRLILTINCPLNRVTLDVTYHAYDNNWFGIVFNDIMAGDAVIYTIGKATDINQFPRAESLYSYRLSGNTVNSVSYTPQLDWTQIQSQITDSGIHIVYQQHLSNTAWDASTRNLVFKYAYGTAPELTQHIFRSDTTFTLNLQTVAPTTQPTQSPTGIPTLRPSTSLPTTEKPSTSPSHSPSMSPSHSPTTITGNSEYIPSNTSMPTPVPTPKPYINASDITVCNETHSCSHKIVDCRSDGGECGLFCTDPFSCENAVYFCSDRATECNVKCLAVGSCKDAQINCAANNKNCVVVSEETNSLQNAIINGAENNSLTVNCSHSINGCVETVINAHLSSTLTMDCRGIRTCENIDIYCPEYSSLHGENVKNCAVIGEGAGSETAVSFHDALQIHAVNSWDDIDLSSYINVNIQRGSKMYCGEAFGEAECAITDPSNMFEWNCMDITSKCYRQIDSYHTIRCDAGGDGECYGTEIHCDDVGDIAQFGGCRIKCNAVHSCSGSKIQCFDDKPCIVECNGQNSCAEHVILQCPDNSDCEIQCNGANSCQYSTVLCPNNNETGYECIVRANGVDSIRDSHISSGNNTHLNVDCASRESCKNARFGAGNAGYLQIDCKDQESGSCENMAVECPQFNEANQEENCYVIGGGENEKHINLSFFCVNGWTDINLDAYVGFLQYNSSKTANTMYCRDDYSESCTMYSLERNLFCQCPDDQSDTALNWVIIICVGIGALFVVLLATVIICGLIEKEKKKYTELESEYDQGIDIKKIHVPAPDGSDRLHH